MQDVALDGLPLWAGSVSWFLGFLVVWFVGLLVSWFLGFCFDLFSFVCLWVSWFPGFNVPESHRFNDSKNHLSENIDPILPHFPFMFSGRC